MKSPCFYLNPLSQPDIFPLKNMRRVSRCLFCNSLNLVKVADIASRHNIELLRCAECALAMTSLLPSKATIEDFYLYHYSDLILRYEKFGWQASPDEARNSASHIFEMLNADNWVQCLIKRCVKISILDFGGRSALESIALAEQIVNFGAKKVCITVVDPFYAELPRASESIVITWCSKISEGMTASYDIVMASSSLEHITNINTVLNQLYASLADGSAIYIKTPYVLPFARLANSAGLKWNFLFPAHLVDFSPFFWRGEVFHQEYPLLREVRSRTTQVQANFNKAPFIWLISALIKLPARLFGARYRFSGGWEIVMVKLSSGFAD